MPSVIIPAYNEEAVIGRLLESLAMPGRPGDLEIWVACNGCTDETARQARRFGVNVIETEVASKSEALRLGDRAAETFPRFYIDADVQISREAIGRVSEELESGRCLAAAPRMRVDLSRVPWTVRAYYDIWLRLPYHLEGMIGSGVYAMSREGRARFDEFPDIISDDGFARLQFAPGERMTVEDAEFTIMPPTSLAGVVHVKTRSQKGLLQLHRRYPELMRNDPRSYSNPLVDVLRDPIRWPASLVYLYVILKTKFVAAWMNYRGDLKTWERDDTSRELK
jgi:glycosyltransferase involved in cell wall biosynthesis